MLRRGGSNVAERFAEGNELLRFFVPITFLRDVGLLSFIIIDPDWKCWPTRPATNDESALDRYERLHRTHDPQVQVIDNAVVESPNQTTRSDDNWLRPRRAIRSGGEADPLAAARQPLRSVMVAA